MRRVVGEGYVLPHVGLYYPKPQRKSTQGGKWVLGWIVGYKEWDTESRGWGATVDRKDRARGPGVHGWEGPGQDGGAGQGAGRGGKGIRVGESHSFWEVGEGGGGMCSALWREELDCRSA